jgi:two-component system OmpR family sensor kinase
VSGSAADGLRRLRWRLSILFTVMNAVGLIVFAWLLISADSQQSMDQQDAELRTITSSVNRLLQYREGTLYPAFVTQDPLDRTCPQFVVLPGGSEQFQPYSSKQICVPMDAGILSTLANGAAQSGRVLYGYERGTDDRLVRVFAEPFQNSNGQYIGAIVAVSDAEPERADHNRLVLMVVGGCVLLVGVVAAAGYVLSRQAMRPAMAALEQQEVLLAETAHDLRTPVAALRALAETAVRHPEQSEDLLPRTVNLAGRMGGIIEGLLVRARLAAGVETLSIQPVRLDQLVTGVVDETPTEGARVTVVAAPTTVNADPALVQRAVANLLSNALRHGRQPGAEPIVHITVAGGRVVVADHGPGVNASVAEQNFDRFTSGGGSTGLGLSIVRWVAQAHGGQLRVYNAEEGGAIFELVLP